MDYSSVQLPAASSRALGLILVILTMLGAVGCIIGWAVGGAGLGARLLIAEVAVLFGAIWSFSRA